MIHSGYIDSTRCGWCGHENSVEHRHWHCPKTQFSRAMIPLDLHPAIDASPGVCASMHGCPNQLRCEPLRLGSGSDSRCGWSVCFLSASTVPLRPFLWWNGERSSVPSMPPCCMECDFGRTWFAAQSCPNCMGWTPGILADSHSRGADSLCCSLDIWQEDRGHLCHLVGLCHGDWQGATNTIWVVHSYISLQWPWPVVDCPGPLARPCTVSVVSHQGQKQGLPAAAARSSFFPVMGPCHFFRMLAGPAASGQRSPPLPAFCRPECPCIYPA